MTIPDRLTAERRAELRATAEASTPGHWHLMGLPWFSDGSGVLAGSPDPHIGFVIADTDGGNEREEYLDNGGKLKLASAEDDAAHIAAFDPPTALLLLSELDRLEAENGRLAAFARWAIGDGAWGGGNLDGGSIQDKAAELGLLIQTKYDPAMHGDSDVAEPGDAWFVFSPSIAESAHD